MSTQPLPLILAFIMLPLSARAAYFPDTPMPDRPGCRLSHCVPLWDGQRRGRRCFWRCPRLLPPPPAIEPPDPPQPPPPRYERAPPRVDVAAVQLPPFGLLAIVAGLLVLAAMLFARSADFRRATDDALSEAAEAAAVKAKLDGAIRDAEDLVKRHAARAYRRGRNTIIGNLK